MPATSQTTTIAASELTTVCAAFQGLRQSIAEHPKCFEEDTTGAETEYADRADCHRTFAKYTNDLTDQCQALHAEFLKQATNAPSAPASGICSFTAYLDPNNKNVLTFSDLREQSAVGAASEGIDVLLGSVDDQRKPVTFSGTPGEVRWFRDNLA